MAARERPREHDDPSSVPEGEIPRNLPTLHTDDRPYGDVPIDDLVKEIMHRISANGKANESLQTELAKCSSSTGAPLAATLQRVLERIAKVLDMLEKSGPNLLKVLHADSEERRVLVKWILNLLGLANQVQIYDHLDRLLAFINVSKDLFPDERRRTTELLNELESRLEAIEMLVEEADEFLSSIKKAILNREVVHEIRLRQLDEAIRNASLEINSGKEILDEAEEVINDLLLKGNAAKWNSRFTRFFLIGVSWHYLCTQYEAPLAIGGGMIATYLLLSMCPENEYKLLEEAKDLQFRHRKLYHDLRKYQTKLNRIRSWPLDELVSNNQN